MCILGYTSKCLLMQGLALGQAWVSHWQVESKLPLFGTAAKKCDSSLRKKTLSDCSMVTPNCCHQFMRKNIFRHCLWLTVLHRSGKLKWDSYVVAEKMAKYCAQATAWQEESLLGNCCCWFAPENLFSLCNVCIFLCVLSPWPTGKLKQNLKGISGSLLFSS